MLDRATTGLGGAVFLFFAWMFVIYAGRAAWRWNVLRRTGRTPLCEAGRGALEASGRVEPLELLQAPLSGLPCVFYEWSIEERRGGDAGEDGWVKLRGGRDGRPFLLTDGSGKIVVHATRAQYLLEAAVDERCWLLKWPSTRMEELLARSGVASAGTLGLNRHLEVSEYLIAPGTALYAIGTARPCGAGEAKGSGATVALDGGIAELQLSDRGENPLRRHHWQGAVRFLGLAIVFGVLGAALLSGRLD